jgi:hypothetical protein
MSAKKNKARRRRNRPTVEYPDQEYQAQVVEIVNDGAMAGTGVVFGKLIPVIIVDARERPDLRDVIKAHDSSRQLGDVRVAWGRPKGRDFDNRFVVYLHVHFVRPIESHALLLFDLKERAKLVDLIIRSRLLYLQAGVPGDRLGYTLDSGRVLIEIPHTGFEKTWDRLLYDSLVTEFKWRGLDKKASAAAAKETISSIREFGSLQLPDSPTTTQ